MFNHIVESNYIKGVMPKWNSIGYYVGVNEVNPSLFQKLSVLSRRKIPFTPVLKSENVVARKQSRSHRRQKTVAYSHFKKFLSLTCMGKE